MTLRIKQIILTLLEFESATSMSELAKNVQVSKRTISRELDEITKILSDNELSLVSKTGVGIWIDGTNENKQLFLKKLKNQDVDETYDIQKRRNYIILELLRENEVRKIFWYSNKFNVSEATISADLVAVEEWFTKFNLKIIKKTGVGVFLDGSEENYRKAIRSFISIDLMKKIGNNDTPKEEIFHSFQSIISKKLINLEDLKRVSDCLDLIDSEKIDIITENSKIWLIINIAIVISRIRKNQIIELNPSWVTGLDDDFDYTLAKEISVKIENEFDIILKNQEICYISLHLKGAKNDKIRHLSVGNPENLGINTLINDMIFAFDKDMAVILKQDEEFISGLISHLEPTLIRLAYDMEIENPILSGIKKDYADIYVKCEKVADVISNWVLKTVPEAEIGFLTVHFGSAVSRAKTLITRKVSVGVICSSGIGVSKIMASKLQATLSEKISVTTYSKRDITHDILEKFDFFISSINFKSNVTEVIEVDPLLPERDLIKIRDLIEKYETLPLKTNVNINTNLEMSKIFNMTSKIKHILDNFYIKQVNDNLDFKDVIDEIGSDFSCEFSSVIKNDLLAREEVSTQIYNDFQFALLHARTRGVFEGKFFAYTSNTEFSAFEFENVKVIFVMLAPENDSDYSDILGNISMLIADKKEFLTEVSNRNIEKSTKLLDESLKKYFIDFLQKGK